jgi:hypothetical protein
VDAGADAREGWPGRAELREVDDAKIMDEDLVRVGVKCEFMGASSALENKWVSSS